MSANGTVIRRNGVTVSRSSAIGVVYTLLILPVLVAMLAAIAWLLWVLAKGLLGTLSAALGVVVLLAGAAAFSWCTRRGFADSLIMVGFGGFTLLIAALYGVAGFALIFGV
jgi:hypothetical protein